MATLEEIEARRADRKAKLRESEFAQVAADLEAIDAIEAKLGDASVAVIEVPYTPGLVARVALRCPSKAEIKRYQDTVRPRGADAILGDTSRAASDLGLACMQYPEGEARTAILDARPGLPTQMGMAALKLASGKLEAEGKE